MKINLSLEGCKNNNTSLGEVLLLLLIANEVDEVKTKNDLINKGLIDYKYKNVGKTLIKTGLEITRNGCELLNSVIIDSDKNLKAPEALTDLAKKLKEIFPKGKKDGTNYYWAEGVALIIRRLRLFFKKYGNLYNDEQIINAAEKYVQSFNGNYTYMKLLKYFIFKEKVGVGGDIEGESELINYIENADQTDNLKNDWTSTLK